jgi:muramoyltetrapeptide carboxypeptidase
MPSISPPFLKIKDQVAVIATAKSFDLHALDACFDTLESWGLKVVKGKNLFNTHHVFAGTDEERAEDLQTAMDDSNIKAIFCARGGYGTSRIIDSIQFKAFQEKPKWIVGFSDITLLLSHVQVLGVESIHGPMPILFGKPGYESSVKALKHMLFGGHPPLEFPFHPLNKPGMAEGELIGGNLTMLHTLLQTASVPRFADKILFIEEVGEYLYHLDRMMVHLKRAGVLKNLKGLVAGHFTDMKDNETPFGKNAYEIISDAVRGYDYPLAFGLPAGHEAPNLPWICGRSVQLSVKPPATKLDYCSFHTMDPA